MLKNLSLTGFTTTSELKGLYAELHQYNPPVELILSLQAKLKTLKNGGEDLQKNYPSMDTLCELNEAIVSFNAHRKDAGLSPFKTSLHYYTSYKDQLAKQVKALFDKTFIPDYLQLNVEWPPVDQVKTLSEQFPDVSVILQVRRVKSTSVIPQLRPYAEYVQNVLIDKSGGRGKPLNAARSVLLATDIKKEIPSLAISFAGGLRVENFKDVMSRIDQNPGDKLPGYGLCMESGIRTIVDGRSHVDPKKVVDILRMVT